MDEFRITLDGTEVGVQPIAQQKSSVFTSARFLGSQICNQRGDPTEQYNHVIRYDSGVITAADGAFEQYIRQDFDADVQNIQGQRRILPIDDDGSFSHAKTFRQNDLEIAVSTWGARQYQSFVDGPRWYAVSVELRGPEGVVADRKGDVDALLQVLSAMYGLKRVTSMEQEQ